MMGWPSPDMDIHVGLRSCIIETKKNTFLYLALDFFNLFLGSGVGTTSYSHFLKLRIQFLVHLYQLFAG